MRCRAVAKTACVFWGKGISDVDHNHAGAGTDGAGGVCLSADTLSRLFVCQGAGGKKPPAVMDRGAAAASAAGAVLASL